MASDDATITGMPAVGDLAQDPVDLGAGADVDALGGLVGDQHGAASDSSARAITTFCWLPPDSAETVASIEGALTVERVELGADDLDLAPGG